MSGSPSTEELLAEARYHRHRYDLYKAKMYGSRPTRLARLRELERTVQGAEARLRRAQQAGRLPDPTPPSLTGRRTECPSPPIQLGEVPARDDARRIRVYDVELPYRRLGRCRMSDPVALALGTRLDQVAAALTTYEERHGRAATASQLLGAGVDLEAKDGPATAVAR